MIQFHGQWDKVHDDLNNLADRISKQLKLATAQNVEVTKSALVKHIQNQDLKWKKLNPKYKAWKKKKGLSTATLISTSELMQSMTTKIASDKLSAFVGVLRSGKRKDGEKPVLIAAVHEFGSKKRKIPKRPLFQPTFSETKDQAVNRYKQAIFKALKSVGK